MIRFKTIWKCKHKNVSVELAPNYSLIRTVQVSGSTLISKKPQFQKQLCSFNTGWRFCKLRINPEYYSAILLSNKLRNKFISYINADQQSTVMLTFYHFSDVTAICIIWNFYRLQCTCVQSHTLWCDKFF